MRILRHLSFLIEQQQWDDVQKRLQSPRGVRESQQQTTSNTSQQGWYPLHHALLHDAPTAVLEQLVQHFPLAAQKPVSIKSDTLRVLCKENPALQASLHNAATAPRVAEDHASTSSSDISFSPPPPLEDAWLPLHLACCNTSSPSVLRLLLSAYPSAVAIPTTLTQFLPLHLACHHPRSHLSIPLILKYFPKAASKITPHNGWLALHYACRHSATLFVVQTLLQFNPEAAQRHTNCGALPLHLACRYQADEGALVLLLAAHPEATKESIGDGGWLPLHLALRCNASSRAIVEILKAFPEAAEVMAGEDGGNYGLLPLHMACWYRAGQEDCIVELVKAFPAAASTRLAEEEDSDDDDENEAEEKKLESGDCHAEGWLPLHHACRHGASDRAIKALLHAYPEGAKQTVKNMEEAENHGKSDNEKSHGWLPLHIACRYKTSVQSLLESYPEGAQQPTPCGSLPLHFACRYGASEDCLQELLAVHPQAARESVRGGSLPLHIACQYGATEGAIEVLLLVFPEGAGHKNDRGWYPLQIACRRGASKDLMVGLAKAFPEAAGRPVAQMKAGTTTSTTTISKQSTASPANVYRQSLVRGEVASL